MNSEIVKWHYIGALWAGPDDGSVGSSRCVINARGRRRWPFGRSGPCTPLVHMQGASVVAPEDGGDALPAFEDPAADGPIVAVAGRTQARKEDPVEHWDRRPLAVGIGPRYRLATSGIEHFDVKVAPLDLVDYSATQFATGI